MNGVGLLRGTVALGLARLGQQNQGGRIGRLSREGQIEEDEGVGVPLEDEDPEGVEGDPGDHDQGLDDDEGGGAEDPGEALGRLPEAVRAEGTLIGTAVPAVVTERVAAHGGGAIPRPPTLAMSSQSLTNLTVSTLTPREAPRSVSCWALS